MLLREYSSKRLFVIRPLLTNVFAPPGENEPQKLGLFSHAVCQKNDTAMARYIFNIYQPILIMFSTGNSYGVWAIKSLFNDWCPFATISLICCKITEAKTTHFWRQWLLVNMLFTEEHKILINNLFSLKGYSGEHLVRQFSTNWKNWTWSRKFTQMPSIWWKSVQ